ncbi:hypothetical protein QCA50_014006 [Cerrena zonata]|uniref:Uncharacterized protein n=1 Tax=Cerrena zonata TaxID=2478898 RepID=A0AAW0FMT4_9APHY
MLTPAGLSILSRSSNTNTNTNSKLYLAPSPVGGLPFPTTKTTSVVHHGRASVPGVIRLVFQ